MMLGAVLRWPAPAILALGEAATDRDALGVMADDGATIARSGIEQRDRFVGGGGSRFRRQQRQAASLQRRHGDDDASLSGFPLGYRFVGAANRRRQMQSVNFAANRIAGGVQQRGDFGRAETFGVMSLQVVDALIRPSGR